MTISGAEPSTFQVSPSFSPDKIDLWKDFPVVQDAWIGTHQALRFELSELDLALELVASRPLTKQDIDNIQEAFEAHIEHSLAHQEQEDKIMIPELKKRCSNNPPNHGGIENELNSKLKSLVKELKVGGDVQELRSELKTYMSIILPHMDEEEAELIPLMRAFFTPKEMSVISREFFTTGPKIMMGSFINNMGDANFRNLYMKREGVPFFVWYLAFKPGLTLFQTKFLKPIKALKGSK